MLEWLQGETAGLGVRALLTPSLPLGTVTLAMLLDYVVRGPHLSSRNSWKCRGGENPDWGEFLGQPRLSLE